MAAVPQEEKPEIDLEYEEKSDRPARPIKWQDINQQHAVDVKTFDIDKSSQITIEQTEDDAKEAKPETKNEYEYLDTIQTVKKSADTTARPFRVVGFGAGAVAGLWVGDPLAGSAMAMGGYLFGATGAALGGVVGGLKSFTYNTYAYYQNWMEDRKLLRTKKDNEKIATFNVTLQSLKTLEQKLQEKKAELQGHEQKLNNTQFIIERAFAEFSKVVVTIGPTGFGKSVVCNRLVGDTRDVDELEEAEEKDIDFSVAEEEQLESETTELQKKMKKVTMFMDDAKTNEGQQKQALEFFLSVVDTPGAFDSSGNDAKSKNAMAQYFYASGGVNMFCVFFRYKTKWNENYSKLLAEYSKFWGEGFWKHCVVIITHCDEATDTKRSSKSQKLQNTKQKISEFLPLFGIDFEIPMFEFGKENYETSLRNMFLVLTDPQSTYYRKYRCDQIVSPMDQLWRDIQTMYARYGELNQVLEKLRQEIEAL